MNNRHRARSARPGALAVRPVNSFPALESRKLNETDALHAGIETGWNILDWRTSSTQMYPSQSRGHAPHRHWISNLWAAFLTARSAVKKNDFSAIADPARNRIVTIKRHSDRWHTIPLRLIAPWIIRETAVLHRIRQFPPRGRQRKRNCTLCCDWHSG
jgi:hypothetical protein